MATSAGKRIEAKRKEKERIAKLWRKKVAGFGSQTEAWEAGYSFAVIAEALGVTRQRVYNQIAGPAPVSPPLRAHLEPLLGLKPAPPAALPLARTYEDQKDYARAQQRRIQKRIDNDEMERIPPILLDDEQLIAKWHKLVDLHGGKTAAVRAMILDS